jgi:hypothetical protein
MKQRKLISDLDAKNVKRRIRRSYTLEQKVEVIEYYTNNVKAKNMCEMAKELKIPRGSLRTIIENKDIIINNNFINKKKTHIRNTQHPFIERALYIWMRNVQDNPQRGITINGDTLKEVAGNFSKIMKSEEVISSGFIERWCRKHNVRCYNIPGQSSSCDKLMLDVWRQLALPKIINSFDRKDIFNLDETGVFWRALPHKSFFVKGMVSHGVKEARERFTAVLVVSMVGEKVTPMIVGKCMNPRSFPRNNIGKKFHYTSSSNAWVTTDIFKKYLRILDSVFQKQNRKIALILDNCSSHTMEESSLTNIKLFFLPPNTTSIGQPLDAGVFTYILFK